jgi:hypothetical protein
VPEHRSTPGDEEVWAWPLVNGTPARTWAVVAWVSVSVWFLAFLLALVLAFLGPQGTRSSLETVAIVGFAVGGVLTFVGFPLMFRQAHREIASGYSTIGWGWIRGSTPLVNPRSRSIEGGTTDRFDAAVARAHAPWSSSAVGASPSPTPPTAPRLNHARAILRSSAIASTVLAGFAILARTRHGTPSVLDTLITGAIVLGGLLVVTLAAAFILRAAQATQLAKVSQLATGIIVSCYSTPQVRASQERLGLRNGVIPRTPVLVFDADGFSIWRASGVPRPVVTIARRDVISLDTTTIYSGRNSTPGLKVRVIPPDERLPFIMEFTLFDPSRMLAAANEEKIGTLITSITDAWCSAAARE